MPYYKFNEDDVFFNRIKTHPSCHFFSWKGYTYYNNHYVISGALNDTVGHVSSPYTSSGPAGYINLHEMNIDRDESKHTLNTKRVVQGDWSLINLSSSIDGVALQRDTSTLVFPWVVKDGSKNSLKSISYDSYIDDYEKGDIISGSYPLTASITRIFYAAGSAENGNEIDPTPTHPFKASPDGKHYYYHNKEQTTVVTKDPHNPGETVSKTDSPKLKKKYIQALENTINYYRKWSPHFIYSSSIDPTTGKEVKNTWDKSYQALSIIDVPSIFFGSSIQKGTVNLKYYITGTLIGQLKDSKRNGELIQVGPSGSFNSGSVAGIVLYNEGALILTGAWDLTFPGTFGSIDHGQFGPRKRQDYQYYGSEDAPSWVFFGTGMNDGYPGGWDAQRGLYTTDFGTGKRALNANTFHSSSFELAFSGTNYIPTITMMAHAKKGDLNWSNNPTYLHFGQGSGSISGSTLYKENEFKTVKNTISSSFQGGFTGSFKKQTFINKIGIYDKDRNLIAIAKVATPVRKLETDEYTFKLKLDI